MPMGPLRDEHILGEDLHFADQRIVGLIERADAFELVDQPDLQWSCRFSPNAGLVEHDADASVATAAQPGRPGDLQQLRRLDRAG